VNKKDIDKMVSEFIRTMGDLIVSNHNLKQKLDKPGATKRARAHERNVFMLMRFHDFLQRGLDINEAIYLYITEEQEAGRNPPSESTIRKVFNRKNRAAFLQMMKESTHE